MQINWGQLFVKVLSNKKQGKEVITQILASDQPCTKYQPGLPQESRNTPY